jgi:hypothetical protein
MSLRERIEQAKGKAKLRMEQANIEPFGDVLFIEPSLAKKEALQKRNEWLRDESGKLVMEKKEHKGKEVSAPVFDFVKTQITPLMCGFISATLCDPETKLRVYTNEEECERDLFGTDARGLPNFASDTLQELFACAGKVINDNLQEDIEDAEKN